MQEKSGFTLLIAIIVTSMLLIVSFVVVNVALKQLILANASKESQYAFYAADGGTECAVYWDFPANGALSRFDPYYTGAHNEVCGESYVYQSLVMDANYSTTTFQINFTRGCAVVSVVKKLGVATTTKIDSKGYNTCDVNALRRYERGVIMSY